MSFDPSDVYAIQKASNTDQRCAYPEYAPGWRAAPHQIQIRDRAAEICQRLSDLVQARNHGKGKGSMIDNPVQVERLLAKLLAAVPIPARATPELVSRIQAQDITPEIKSNCMIAAIHYAGDEGGIVCKLDFGIPAENAVFTSITHLRFDPRLPLTREITAYQKHRVKRLQRQPQYM